MQLTYRQMQKALGYIRKELGHVVNCKLNGKKVLLQAECERFADLIKDFDWLHEDTHVSAATVDAIADMLNALPTKGVDNTDSQCYDGVVVEEQPKAQPLPTIDTTPKTTIAATATKKYQPYRLREEAAYESRRLVGTGTVSKKYQHKTKCTFPTNQPLPAWEVTNQAHNIHETHARWQSYC